MDHTEFSKKGGSAKSAAKTKAAIANAKMPRGIWMTAVSFEFEDEAGQNHTGVVLRRGKPPGDAHKFFEWLEGEIIKEPGYQNKQVVSILDTSCVSQRFTR